MTPAGFAHGFSEKGREECRKGGGGKGDSRNGGEREIAGKWKFREAGRRKNAARHCSIDMLLRRLPCLLEFSGRRERERENGERAVRKDTPGSQGSKQICTAFLALGIARFLAGSWIFETRFEIVKA
jgi:hypothetical protein